jgi:DNA primase
VRHGIVFGDGSLDGNGQWEMSYVNLHMEKADDLLCWFDGYPQRNRQRPTGEPYTIIRRLPSNFKELPYTGCAPEYFAGFLAGYLATDGCVAEDGTVMLHSANREDLEYVRFMSARIGIGSHEVTHQLRTGLGPKPTPIYRIHFVTSHLHSELLIRPRAKERYESNRKCFERHRWTVRSVEPTDRVEEVYCAEVDGTHAFAIEGNILTGNCYGCSWTGDVIKFVQDAGGIGFVDAVKLLIEQYGADGRESVTNPEALKRIRDIQAWFQAQRSRTVMLMGFAQWARQKIAGAGWPQDDPRRVALNDLRDAIIGLAEADCYLSKLTGQDIGTFYDAYGRKGKPHPIIQGAFSKCGSATQGLIRRAFPAWMKMQAESIALDEYGIRAGIASAMLMAPDEQYQEALATVKAILAGKGR